MNAFSTARRRTRRLRRRARLGIVALTVAATTATMAIAAPMAGAHPGQPSAVFDPNEVAWAEVRDRTVTEFDADLKTWNERGHFVVDLEADTFGGDMRFAAAFQRNIDNRGWLIDTVMTAAEYDAKFAQAKKDGLRLVDREIYDRNGVRYYGAVWVENVENLGWHAKHDLTLTEFKNLAKDQEKARRMPIDFDMYRTSSGIRYGVIFLDNPENLDWHLHGDFTSAGYATKFDEYDAAGFRMLSFDSAPAGSTQLFGGIWIENANDRGWKSRRNMTSLTYGNWWHEYADEGYRQIFVGRYQTTTGISYASLWRQNNDRLDWRYRIDVNNLIEAEMSVDDLPGVSVAVMQGGKFRYTRGFGYADIETGVRLDSSHVLRTASVSKAVGGAMLLRLEEQGKLLRDDAVSAHHDPGDLPAHHTSNLEELASNRGCVRHYATSTSPEAIADPEEYEAQEAADAHLASTKFFSAYGATLHFRDDPLLLNCTVGSDEKYSTPGYSLLASGFEHATDVAIQDLVRQQISDPLGLKTLRQEDTTDTTVNRAKIYAGEDNDEIDYDEMSWKTLGGGLESNVRDLATFGHAWLGGQIISPANVDYVLNGADKGWDYAYGWNILDDENGHERIGKSGGGPGADSYMLAFPDDDVVIAVLINREELDEDDNNAGEIAKSIGALMF